VFDLSIDGHLFLFTLCVTALTLILLVGAGSFIATMNHLLHVTRCARCETSRKKTTTISRQETNKQVAYAETRRLSEKIITI